MSCVRFRTLNFLLFLLYNVQIKRKKTMNYYLMGSNVTYGNEYCFNNFMPTYYYPTFDTCGVYTPFIPYKIIQNFQVPYTCDQWFPTKIEVPNTKEGPGEVCEVNSQENEKSSTQLVNQRKNRNAQKQLESAKKNCESNIVNQFLSYFSSFNNSSSMIARALKKMKMDGKLMDQKDIDKATLFFCKQISIVNSRRERKYVNKALLMNYFTVQKLEKYMPDILEKVGQFDLLSKEEFCELFRRCCYNFFRTISVSSVTSSAKLHKISRPQHIKRRRLIVERLEKA